MWAYNNTEDLYHHGIKGQKWGVRRYQNEDGSLTSAGKKRYSSDTSKVKINADGSEEYLKGHVFNRVGGERTSFNKSGGLYVSSGFDDASRYVAYMGPTKLRSLFLKDAYATHNQQIEVVKKLKTPSSTEYNKMTAEFLKNNSSARTMFNDSLYSWSYTENDAGVSISDLDSIIKNPSSNNAYKLSMSFSQSFGNGEDMGASTRAFYDHVRKRGYNAVPDYADRLGGTSKTALIVLDPSAVKQKSSTVLTEDYVKEAKRYIKTLEKLKVSELVK